MQREPWGIKLDIVVQVVGTRGHVQPFITLGNELQKYGHRVRIPTHNVFEDFVRWLGLGFYPVAEISRVNGVHGQKSWPTTETGVYGRERSNGNGLWLRRCCWKSCIEADMATLVPFMADAVIANPMGLAYVHCAQALGVPLHLMFTMPWSSIRAFPHPLANLKYSSTDPRVATTSPTMSLSG